MPLLFALVGDMEDVHRLEHDRQQKKHPQQPRQAPHALRVGLHVASLAEEQVEEREHGDPRHDRGGQEDHRHQRRRPPGIGLDRAEQEADVAMEHTRRRDPDHREGMDEPAVDLGRPGGDLDHSQGEGAVDPAPRAGRRPGALDDRRPEDEPDIDEEDEHVEGIDETEARHRRGGARRRHDIERPQRLMEMEEEGERGAGPQAERRDHRQAGHRPQRLAVEDVVHRRHDERPGHHPCDVGIEDDHDAPRRMGIVGEDEWRVVEGVKLHHVTSSVRPT